MHYLYSGTNKLLLDLKNVDACFRFSKCREISLFLLEEFHSLLIAVHTGCKLKQSFFLLQKQGDAVTFKSQVQISSGSL